MKKQFSIKHIWIAVTIFLLLSITSIFRESLLADVKDLLGIKPQQYYGATVDMSQILPESKYYVVNNKGEDLVDISKKLGINVLRITNIRSISQKEATPSFTHNQWKEVLDKLRKKGISAVILVEGNNIDRKFHDSTLDTYYVNFVKNYVLEQDLCSFSNIIAIDIRNEALLNDENIQRLREAKVLIKSSCPDLPITLGSWRTDSGKKDKEGEVEYNWHDPKEVLRIDDLVDIHSVHIYGFDKKEGNTFPDPYQLTISYIREIRKYTNKPILIEEFGAGNGTVTTDQKTFGSEELQKKTYEGVLKATYDLKNSNVLGAIAYLLQTRSDEPDGWNILEDNGNTLLPAAEAFKSFR